MAETLVWDEEASPTKAIPNDLPKQEDATTHHYHWDTYNITHKHKGHHDHEYSHAKETKMSDGINTDKVIVNAGGQGDGGGMGAAALVAALGQRNQGNDNAALIAALGDRNNDSATWGPMMAMMANRHPGYGDGFGGMNGILGIAALGLIFGRGRGGLFGGDGDGDAGAETRLQSNADTLAILNSVGNTKDAVTGGFATTALALSQGFANLKDSQQASTFLLSNQLNTVNQNVSEQACQTREVVLAAQTAILGALKDNRIAELEDKVRGLDHHGHVRDSEIRISQNVSQVQAQAQQQQQQQAVFDRLERLVGNVIGNQVMLARQGQDIVNLGTMTASGTQAAANTQVR